jgi:hypothetical protein
MIMEKEVTEQQRRLQVKQKYLERIQYVISKGLLDQRDLYITIRGFFSEFLKLDYEFTYEELSLELNKVFIKPADKLSIDNFLFDLSESEYLTDKNLEQEEIKDFLTKLESIIQSLISDSNVESKKKGFFEALLKKKPVAEESITDISVQEMDILKDESTPIEMPRAETLPIEMMKQPEPGISDFMQSQKENYLLKAGMFLHDIEHPKIADEHPIPEKSLPEIPSIDKTTKPKKSKAVSKSSGDESKNSGLMMAKENPEMPTQSIAGKQQIPIPINDPLLLEDNNPDIVKIHGLMEESYINININNIDEAKMFYLKALELYHKLNYENKNQIYPQLYHLYERLGK